MTDYIVCGEVDGATSVSGAASSVVANTNSWAYETARGRGAIKILGDGVVEFDDVPSITSGWLMYDYAKDSQGTSDDDNALVLRDIGAAQDIIRMRGFNGELIWERWNGSGWTSIVDVNTANQTRNTFHIEFVISSTGRFVIYDGPNAIGSFVGDTDPSSLTVERLQLRSRNHSDFSGNRDSNFSQIYLSSKPTLNCRVETLEFTGDEVNGFDSGGFADVDDVVDHDDATLMASGTANQLALFQHPNMVALTSAEEIRSVALSVRALRDTTGPQNLRPVMRSGGTDYNGSNYGDLGTVASGRQTIWETDPDTSLSWTETGVNNMFPGFESQT